MSFWRKLNYLVPEPLCRTRGNRITEWTDARPQPTDAEINAVDIADVEAAELDTRAFDFADNKKAFAAFAEILYENPDLNAAFPTVADFKAALKERFKSKL